MAGIQNHRMETTKGTERTYLRIYHRRQWRDNVPADNTLVVRLGNGLPGRRTTPHCPTGRHCFCTIHAPPRCRGDRKRSGTSEDAPNPRKAFPHAERDAVL